MQLSDDLTVELEALQAIYDSAVTVVSAAASGDSHYGSASVDARTHPQAELRLQLAPQTGGEEASVFVLAMLGISVPLGYPQQAPACSLITAKGLGDARAAQLLAGLQQTAAEAAGDMMLVQLAAAAQDFINAANAPEGDCPICMFPLAGSSNEAAQKLPCFHCMHRECFLRWWHWSQAAEAARAATLRKEQGPAAGRAIAAAGLVPDAEGRHRLACPACRADVLPAELHPSPPLPRPAAGHAAYAGRDAAAGAPARGRGPLHREEDGDQVLPESRRLQLPPQQLAALRAQQAERRAAFERQRRQGGIIEDTGWGLSTSAPRQAPPQPPALEQQQAAGRRGANHKPAAANRQAAVPCRATPAAPASGTTDDGGASANVTGSAAAGQHRRTHSRAGRGRRRGGGSASAPGAPL